jgi:hypothetical protein
MNDVVVIFSDNNTRILSGVNGNDYSSNSNILINPIIPSGIPPHKWKLSHGKIVIHDEVEIQRRESLLNQSIIDNKEIIMKPKLSKLLVVSLGLNILLISLYIMYFIK